MVSRWTGDGFKLVLSKICTRILTPARCLAAKISKMVPKTPKGLPNHIGTTAVKITFTDISKKVPIRYFRVREQCVCAVMEVGGGGFIWYRAMLRCTDDNIPADPMYR